MSSSPQPARLLLAALAALLLLSGLFPQTLQAQDIQSDQIREYIDRNGELLDSALEIVADTESMPPRRILGNARDLHVQSIRLLESNRSGLALQAARRCRDGIRQAVLLARESLGSEERLRQRLERYLEQHANLLDLAREGNHERAQELLMRSRRMFDRARDQYRQGELRLALQLLDQAEELMNRAARQLVGPRGDRLERALELATASVQQARETLQGNDDPAARDLLSESEKALERAHDFRNRGRPGRALQMAGLARRLARRAEGLQADAPDPEGVARQIERWDERASRLTENLNAAGEDARALFQRAREHRQRASQRLATGDLEPALLQIRAAHDLLGQLEDRLR